MRRKKPIQERHQLHLGGAEVNQLGAKHRQLPTPAEALDQPLRAFPSWFLRIESACCGAMQMISETPTPQHALTIREIIARMRHDGCGGRVRS